MSTNRVWWMIGLVSLIAGSGCSTERKLDRMLNGKGRGADGGLAEGSWMEITTSYPGGSSQTRCVGFDPETLDTAGLSDLFSEGLPMPGMCDRKAMFVGCMGYLGESFLNFSEIYSVFLIIDNEDAHSGEISNSSAGSGVAFLSTDGTYELYPSDGESSITLTEVTAGVSAIGSFWGDWELPSGETVSVDGEFEMYCL